MVINAKEIKLFDNLAQFEMNNLSYDFHNDFNCTSISFQQNCLTLLLKHISKEILISLEFQESDLEKTNILPTEFKNLTIDNLYRGRTEKNGKLIEFNEKNQSFFYLEFYENFTIEFWCASLLILEV